MLSLKNIFIASALFLLIIVIKSCCKDENIEDVTYNDSIYYKTIKIGEQVWMAENLKTTHFNNGTDIPKVNDNSVWISLNSPGVCFYNNNEKNYRDIYGALYNYFAVATGKLCPSGWHIPSIEDWSQLIYNLGGTDSAGIKLKEEGTAHWPTPNNSDNSSGFTALPGGYRAPWNGTYTGINMQGLWWSSSLVEGQFYMGTQYERRPLFYGLSTWSDSIQKLVYPSVKPSINGKVVGASIRCIKD
ncbi:MAG: hypothetical protein A2X05_01405 [Bacteroidetes bacterium GWE2_41_25]|nr:MAG: hypothetical protein A2X03_00575 [Bacteroidetes bacterium GWA2_40_15]OFX87467.1 MAG: hypothetical protein A2X06_13600 [Bacteroidetes bacterium GWC2_40_22]OFY00920.1 MAG: hypothetical protein A2X05_01405 [Bacteroidetes bacterium GWE2_41_25]OFY60820.1 MAG: hypothetical protein A2X04_01670 [Bacteroidetes bacterium GWF2_41_9]HBQ84640.1 hypothetical protein [Bacteroidales bacterium]